MISYFDIICEFNLTGYTEEPTKVAGFFLLGSPDIYGEKFHKNTNPSDSPCIGIMGYTPEHQKFPRQ